MRAYLHGNHAAVLVAHLGEQLLQVGRLRGGVLGGAMLAADLDANRADKARAIAQVLGDMVYQIGSGGFAVRARNAHQGELFRGLAIEAGRHARHGLTGILHHNFRNLGSIGQVDLALYDQDARAAIDGVLSVGVAIALQAHDAAERIARLHAIASVCNAGNRLVRIADDGAINTFKQLSACLLCHENLNSE